MQETAKHASDAGSYAPVTVLVDERCDGVHRSRYRMAGFFGRPDEVAKAVVFLASDESSYITESEMFVDGGFAQV